MDEVAKEIQWLHIIVYVVLIFNVIFIMLMRAQISAL